MSDALNQKKIAERGSLTLHHFTGDDRNPETFTVALRDDPRFSASLEVARDWFELSGQRGETIRLNGSQALTVRTWQEEYL